MGISDYIEAEEWEDFDESPTCANGSDWCRGEQGRICNACLDDRALDEAMDVWDDGDGAAALADYFDA